MERASRARRFHRTGGCASGTRFSASAATMRRCRERWSSPAVPVGWRLAAHLALVGTLKAPRRVADATVATLCLLGLLTFASRWSSFEFSRQVHFDAALRPLPRAWIPGAPVEAILAEVPELESEVRRLATQKPRAAAWLAGLEEGDGELASNETSEGAVSSPFSLR